MFESRIPLPACVCIERKCETIILRIEMTACKAGRAHNTEHQTRTTHTRKDGQYCRRSSDGAVVATALCVLAYPFAEHEHRQSKVR